MVTDYDLRAFDLDFSNSPTLVLTAKVPAPSAKPAGGGEFDYFVTVVARVDINGQAQKIFSSVTDNNHLDAFPRLEIIDALDADANGRGDLLFRQHSDSGVSYALYRVYPYQMVKIFEGGGGNVERAAPMGVISPCSAGQSTTTGCSATDPGPSRCR